MSSGQASHRSDSAPALQERGATAIATTQSTKDTSKTSPAIAAAEAPTAVAPATFKPISLSDIELPKGCHFVSANGKAIVAVCPAAPDSALDKFLLTAPSIAISLIALVISGFTLKYNRGKDERARVQSIQDDFWIRKIVSPISIEPFLKYIQELGTILPTASQDLHYVEQTWGDQANKLGEFRLSFQILNVVDSRLQANVSEKLDELEDRITIYCGQLMAYLDNEGDGELPSKDECLHDCNSLAISIFKLIQASQTAVGKSK